MIRCSIALRQTRAVRWRHSADIMTRETSVSEVMTIERGWVMADSGPQMTRPWPARVDFTNW